MTNNTDLRFWDTSAITAFIKGENGKVDDCKKLLEEAESGVYLAITTPMSIVETTRQKGGTAHSHRELIDNFFLRVIFEIVSIDRYIAMDAKDLIWKYELGPTDAVQVAVALNSNCTTFYSYDRHHLKLDGEFEGVRFCEPVWTGQIELPITSDD